MRRLNTMHLYSEEDIANHALELLSITSSWLLVRHQWLIDTMRCVLTGESPPPLSELKTFDEMVPSHFQLSENLTESFAEIKSSLESHWLKASKTTHPVSGLTIFEQLNSFQSSAHHFMQASKEANQKLLHEFAMRDALTGTWSRLTLDTNLSQALSDAVKHQQPYSVALLDQDKFKLINDRWGHIVGDQVLAKTAEIIESKLRPNDKLFRFGGDEWLIIMPKTPQKLAKQVLDNIKESYCGYEFRSSNNESFFSTFSYGIAESSNMKTAKEWVIHADNNLYENKRKKAA